MKFEALRRLFSSAQACAHLSNEINISVKRYLVTLFLYTLLIRKEPV